MGDLERLQGLARLIAIELGNAPPQPKLRIVGGIKTPPAMDSVTRESHLRLIRSIRRYYKRNGVDLIINRATLGKGEIDNLNDDELISLHDDLNRALDCIANDVTFEDAGLLRPGI